MELLAVQIPDRIKELRRVPASQLEPHPRNWRTHPDSQRTAMRSLLADVGYADALLARELPDGRLQLIDGHLRAEITPECVVPVLVLDVDESEAERILMTHDPIAHLAETNACQLSELRKRCELDHPHVERLLDELSRESGAAADRSKLSDIPAIEIPEAYQVVVECNDELEQQTVYEQMRKEGFRCRLLTL